MRIRKFKKGDAKAAHDIIRECHLKLNLGNYTKAVNEGQINDNTPEKLIVYSKTVKYYVVEIGGKVAGIGGYEKDKVRTFFIKPVFQRQSIGSLILKKVLSEAKKEGINKLGCWSTLFSESFYRSFGFKRTRKLSIPYCNGRINFIEMEKILK
jgi:GNAT superfamily N-acetyltransferase